MRSSHDEAREDRGTAVELVLTGRRLPRSAQLYLAIMIARLVGLHTSPTASDPGHPGAKA